MQHHDEAEARTRPFPLWAALGVLVLAAGPALANEPDAATLVRRMKAALEPDRPSIRKLTITISAGDGEATKWIVGQARKRFEDGNRILIVMLAPPDVKGSAYLMREMAANSGVEEDVYFPTVRRVRRVLPIEGFRAFLNSDFTLADLGFVSLRATYRLIGEGTRAGVHAYQIDEMPTAPEVKWYYSHTVTWIAVDTALPVERDFYDSANALWKVETFGDVKEIDGVATPQHLRMDDKQGGGYTEIDVGDVRYGVDIPDSLFEIDRLGEAASWSHW